MLKKYSTVYKKLQKQRKHDLTSVILNEWSLCKLNDFPKRILIFFIRPYFIKLKFFKKLRRKFRKTFKKRKLSFMFYCKPNFLVHEKFKNARMGKGKGSPVYWVYKPIITKPFAILTGVHEKRALHIINFLKKHMGPWIYFRKNY